MPGKQNALPQLNFQRFETRLKKGLGEDFVFYHDVRINGQQVDLLGQSSGHGIIAIFDSSRDKNFLDLVSGWQGSKKYVNGADKTLVRTLLNKKAERIRLIISMPSNLFSVEEKYSHDYFKNRDCLGFLCIHLFCAAGNCLKQIVSESEYYIDLDSLDKNDKLEKLLSGFLQISTRSRFPVEIDHVNAKIALWLATGNRSEKKQDLASQDLAWINRLNVRQRSIITRKTKRGRLRIRGPAGSGKTEIIATRGAMAILEGRRTLFLTFNIVAKNYLQDRVGEILLSAGHNLAGSGAEFYNFHGLLGKFVPYQLDRKASRDEADRYLNTGWCNEATHFLAENRLQEADRYDAIFIDEGQDFRRQWWQFACGLLKTDGEITLAADHSQNIYDVEPWADLAMESAGGYGQWNTLEGSYRLPEKMLVPAREFAAIFLPEGIVDLPEKPADKMYGLISDLHLRWLQVSADLDGGDLAAMAFKEYTRLKLGIDTENGKGTRDSDTVFLVSSNKAGLALEAEFELQDTVFYSTIKDSDAKRGFHRNLPFAKITTIHSFKGLETNVIILLIENIGKHERLSKEIYIALTRIAEARGRDSHFTVICQNEMYADYGRTWTRRGGKFVDLRKDHVASLVRNVSVIESSRQKADLVFSKDLYDLVISKGNGFFNPANLNVNANVHNSPAQNTAYLHDYFFRSYTESHVIWSQLLQNSDLAKHLGQKKFLRILSYGCGTGGNLAGMLAAFHSFARLPFMTIEIIAIDGNHDALEKCTAIIGEMAKLWDDGFVVKLSVVHNLVKNLDFAGNLDLADNSCDIIESSKMINELLSENYGAYYRFMDTFVKRFLARDGLALVLDVPVRRMIRTQTDEYSFAEPVYEWVTRLMSRAIGNFVSKNSKDFAILLPVPCGQCKSNYCYSAKMYSYRFFSQDSPLVLSPVCFRLVAGMDLARKIGRHHADDIMYVTCFRKDGKMKGCQLNGHKEQDLEFGSDMTTDGYRL